jgi:hypothetical protein
MFACPPKAAAVETNAAEARFANGMSERSSTQDVAGAGR